MNLLRVYNPGGLSLLDVAEIWDLAKLKLILGIAEKVIFQYYAYIIYNTVSHMAIDYEPSYYLEQKLHITLRFLLEDFGLVGE